MWTKRARSSSLMDKGETKPIKVESPAGTEKSALEGLLEASLEGRAGAGQNGGPKQLFRKNRVGRRKQLSLQVARAATAPKDAESSPPIEPSGLAPSVA